ncbi:MAG: heme biosynthesis HemY N-terminal domain-containing protein [Rhodospirillaceae bacterium]
MRLVLYLIVLFLAVSAAVWLANDPGNVALEWRGWRIDTSASMLIAVMIAGMFIAAVLLRGLAFIAGLMKSIAAARRERRLNRGLTSLADGFAAVQAGQTNAARKFAREANALLQANPAVFMLRKQTAELAGDMKEMKEAATALLARPQTELAGLRSLALKAAADGDTVGALNHAKRALSRKDAPAWAIEMALDLAISSGLWRDALSLIDTKIARETFAAEDFKRIKTRLLLQQAQVDLKTGDSISAAALARQAIDIGGAPVPATAAYARAMAAQGKGRKAAHLIEKLWGETPHADLAAAYKILIPGESALDWARRVDNLARIDADHPETRLAVASASLEAELWGQARNRLAPLTAETGDPDVRARAARLLAEVELRERRDADKAAEWLKMALEARRETDRSAPRNVAELARA